MNASSSLENLKATVRQGAQDVINACTKALEKTAASDFVVYSTNVWDRRVLVANAQAGLWMVKPSLEPKLLNTDQAELQVKVINRNFEAQGTEERMGKLPAREWFQRQIDFAQKVLDDLEAMGNE